MGTLETAFAVTVTVLAAIAVILVLLVAIGWLAVQVNRLRRQLWPPDAWWRQRGATAPTIPERRP